MNISFNGINESIVTFIAKGTLKPGDLVSVCDNDTIKKAADNENFIGVCFSYKSGIAAIQLTGFATIKAKNIANIKYGRQYFVSSDDASLKLSEPNNPLSVPLNVISINKTSSTIGVFL